MQVGHINIRNSDEANAYNFESIVKPYLSDLHQLSTSNYLLSGGEFQRIHPVIQFTQFRVYCRKTSQGRTNHFTFDHPLPDGSDNKMFKHILWNGVSAPDNYCGYVKFMPDDDSTLRTSACTDLSRYYYDRNWLRYRLYSSMKNGVTQLKTYVNTRLKCDDDTVDDKIGQWMFFLR